VASPRLFSTANVWHAQLKTSACMAVTEMGRFHAADTRSMRDHTALSVAGAKKSAAARR
jgi:hypothetical protein